MSKSFFVSSAFLLLISILAISDITIVKGKLCEKPSKTWSGKCDNMKCDKQCMEWEKAVHGACHVREAKGGCYCYFNKCDHKSKSTPSKGGSSSPPSKDGSLTPPSKDGSSTPPKDWSSSSPPANGGSPPPPADGGSSSPPSGGGSSPPPSGGGLSPPPADGGGLPAPPKTENPCEKLAE